MSSSGVILVLLPSVALVRLLTHFLSARTMYVLHPRFLTFVLLALQSDPIKCGIASKFFPLVQSSLPLVQSCFHSNCIYMKKNCYI